MTKHAILLLSFCLTICSIDAQTRINSLNEALTAISKRSGLPGFAVALVDEHKVLYQKGFGHADVEKQTPYTIHTIQNIGSVSKTFLGITLMKLVEEGKIKLDDPINQYLPFEINHPRYVDVPITIRDLATHTSGIKDKSVYFKHCYVPLEPIDPYKSELKFVDRLEMNLIKGNKPMPLGAFLKDYLNKDGKWYKKKNFAREAPGSQYEYSNIGAALAAYVIECVVGMPYYEYSRTAILESLSMLESGWRFEDVDMNQHASVYTEYGAKIPPYTLVTYPDGGLLTNCHDLSIYLQQMISGFSGKDNLVKATSYDEIQKTQFKDEGVQFGLFWDINKRGHLNHNGGDPGIFSYIHVFPEKKQGLVFLTNTMAYESEELMTDFKEIWETLKKFML